MWNRAWAVGAIVVGVLGSACQRDGATIDQGAFADGDLSMTAQPVDDAGAVDLRRPHDNGSSSSAPDLVAADLLGVAPADLTTSAPADLAMPTSAPLDGLCIEDGWCWERPTQFGAELRSIWGSSFDNVWVVGDGGTIVHFDGTTWTRVAPITNQPLYAVHGSGPNDVWAVGRRVILHFDGNVWSLVGSAPATKGQLRAVHVVAKNDVWFGGDYFARLHFDGATWSLTEEPTVQAARAIIGFASHDVWAVGDNSFVSHWDGTKWEWTGSTTSTFATCYDAWGTAADNLYVACLGYDGVSRWDGTTWTQIKFPTGVSPSAHAIAGSNANDIWLISDQWHSAHWNGTAWTREVALENDSLLDAWLDPATGKGFAIGAGGRIVRRDSGTTWTEVSGLRKGYYDDLTSAFALSNDDIWAVGRLRVLRYRNGAWGDVPAAPTTYRQEFTTVWASGADDAWIAGWGDLPNSLQRWNGTAFSVFAGARPDYDDYLDAIFGFAANDVWIMNSRGEPLHWDGAKLTNLAPDFGGGSRGGVHGIAPDDVWLMDGGLRHWDGKTLTRITLPTPVPAPLYSWEVTAVHAIAANDVWVAGENNYLVRWDGATWTQPPKPALSGDLYNNLQIGSIAGVSSSDLWATATNGDILHFDGTAWRLSANPGQRLSAITRTPSGQLIVVGGSGAILRRK